MTNTLYTATPVLYTPSDGRARTGAVVRLEDVVLGHLHLAEREGSFCVNDPNVMMFEIYNVLLFF